MIATNPDFSDLYRELQEPNALLGYLSSLQTPVTLFAFTNEAQQDSMASFNHTVAQAETDPAITGYRLDGEHYSVVTEPIPVSPIAKWHSTPPACLSFPCITHCMHL